MFCPPPAAVEGGREDGEVQPGRWGGGTAVMLRPTALHSDGMRDQGDAVWIQCFVFVICFISVAQMINMQRFGRMTRDGSLSWLRRDETSAIHGTDRFDLLRAASGPLIDPGLLVTVWCLWSVCAAGENRDSCYYFQFLHDITLVVHLGLKNTHKR